jgi:hypothetical protein
VLAWVRSRWWSRRSVLQDWLGALPPRQMETFKTVTQKWNSLYVMGSVALQGAFELCPYGDAICAVQQVKISGELLSRLADELNHGSEIMQDEARHLAIIPAVAPLEPASFRGSSIRWPISLSKLLHQVTFSERNQFFHKLRALERTVEVLISEFQENTEILSESPTLPLLESWIAFERLHDDLNTCLREYEVVLKGFLRAVPLEIAPQIAARLEAPAEVRARSVRRAAEVSV